MKNHEFRVRNRYLVMLDLVLCVIAYISVIILVHPLRSTILYLSNGIGLIVSTGAIYLLTNCIFSIYNVDWVHAGVIEYLRLIISCFSAFVICIVTEIIVPGDLFYPKFNIAANIVICVFICAVRFFARILSKLLAKTSRRSGKRILVIGAGNLAVMLLHDIEQNEKLNYNVVGLIDDDPRKKNLMIYGSRVLGTSADIERICKTHKIEEIIMAIFTITPERKAEILDICSETGKKVKILPGIEASLNSSNTLKMIREVDINDLLERDPIELDNQLIWNDIKDKVVLVTGGGGSIGSELCRQIVRYKPAKLVIVDIYENTTYELQNELEEKYPQQSIDVLIASVRDKKRLELIFEKYRPEIVFHAAAHKHVPLMEFSPCEAIKNNIFGTYNTAACAEKYGVKRFVLISTDKAVNPTNVMGASKRMCEMIIQTMAKLGTTEFVAVRFGNVLGSNGSVIPRFKKQIAAGGPVTVTHPEITRFFMTIPEAAQLVLQAGSYAKGGEIFVLDMGRPVKIYDLAKKLIKLSGFVPDKEIKINFTGLRAGEKLYEELLMNEEGLKTTAHSKIFVGKPIDIDKAELDQKLRRLESAVDKDEDEVKRIVSEVVPTYNPMSISEKESKKELSAV